MPRQSDLLNGFQAGMQLGAPLVEAALRKKAFQREAAERARDRAARAGEASSERALRRQMSRDGITSAEKIAAAREAGLDSRHKETTEVQRDANDASAKLRRRQLKLEQQKRDDAQPKTRLSAERDALQSWISEGRDMEDALKSNVLDPEYRRVLEDKLAAHSTQTQIMAKRVDLALATGNPKDIDDMTASLFAPVEKPSRLQAVPIERVDTDDGEATRYRLLDPEKGWVDISEEEAKGMDASGEGKIVDGDGGISLRNDGTLTGLTPSTIDEVADKYGGEAFAAPTAPAAPGQLGGTPPVTVNVGQAEPAAPRDQGSTPSRGRQVISDGQGARLAPLNPLTLPGSGFGAGRPESEIFGGGRIAR